LKKFAVPNSSWLLFPFLFPAGLGYQRWTAVCRSVYRAWKPG